MIRLEFAALHIDGPAPRSKYDMLLRVVADFSISRGATELWSEIEFPILELAADLRQWLAASPGIPFIFETMESDEKEYLWFKPMEKGWAIGAAGALLTDGIELEELRSASSRFIEDAIIRIQSELGVDARRVIAETFE